MVQSTDSSKSNSIGFPHFGNTMNPDFQGNFVGSNGHNQTMIFPTSHPFITYMPFPKSESAQILPHRQMTSNESNPNTSFGSQD